MVHAPGIDARLRRFAAGAVGPDLRRPVADPGPARGESQPGDAYGSEVPDLSEPAPRPVQRAPRVQVEGTTRQRGPVRASMQVRRIDPWSTLKVSLLLSVSLFFVWMFAVALLYLILGAMGVWGKLSTSVQEAVNPGGPAGELVSAGSIFGGAALIGLVNIVLLTAMATVGAVIYNLSTDLVGGVEVTLADRD